jgi:hypothetical protein
MQSSRFLKPGEDGVLDKYKVIAIDLEANSRKSTEEVEFV